MTASAITGDIIFQHTNWESLTSENTNETTILDFLEHSNFEQILPCQNSRSLDVLLTQDGERTEHSAIDKKLEGFYSLSDHHLLKTKMRDYC